MLHLGHQKTLQLRSFAGEVTAKRKFKEKLSSETDELPCFVQTSTKSFILASMDTG